MPEDAVKVLIIGSGPAGYTAAIYTSRAMLEPLLIAGTQMGGQLMLTSEVENYPGFPDGVLGPELMEKFRTQAERFGTRVVQDDVMDVDLSGRPFRVITGAGEHLAESIIIATGSSARWLGLPSETRLRGRGVSACATCDGFFFKDNVVAVVGGGDSAMEESLFLTKFASRVHIVHRRDALRASRIMQERVLNHPKISILWDSVVVDVLGDQKVEGIKLKNVKTNEVSELACQGLFLAIGHIPNTSVFKGKIELDAKGYIVTREHTMTSVPGVFAAGDVRDHRYRQAVTAAGDGCRAAIDAERWLQENPL